MAPRITPSTLAAIVLAAGGAGCGIPLDGYEAFTCAEDASRPALAAGFSPPEPVDSIELRTGTPGAWTVVDSAGTPCATATNTDDCLAALEAADAPEGSQRLQYGECVSLCPSVVLVYTRGDEVGVVSDAEGLTAFLGAIDTAEEAAAEALAAGFSLACASVESGGVRPSDDGFELIATEYTSTCSPIVRNRVQLGVTSSAEVSVLDTQEIERNLLVCIGRRPEGLEATPASHPPADEAALGEWLADVTRLEAAAVHAFSELGAALAAHGAPEELLDRVAEARDDEVRHARDMGRLARRFGGCPTAPRVHATPTPSLEALAHDNAVEGCVRETFGALIGLWQASAAEDPAIRATMARIGADEARHAALSWAIAAWAEPRLDPAARARVEAARAEAMAGLHAGVQEVPAALQRLAGLPPVEVQRRLVAGLARLAA